MLKKFFSIISALVAFIIFLSCIGLLAQSYFARKTVYYLEMLNFGSFKPGFEILGYDSVLLGIGGFMLLLIAQEVSKFFVENKKISYISALIGTILVCSSFGLLFISRKLEQEWLLLGYCSMITSGMGLIALTFYKLVTTEHNLLSRSLKFIGYMSILVGTILNFLAY